MEHSGQLGALLRAKSVALVGASERSIWANAAFRNFAALGFAGRVYPVNAKGGMFHDLAAAATCRAIGEEVDAALLMVPADALDGAMADLADAGIRSAVILSSGYAEAGQAGRIRQRELADLARDKGIMLLGPNCLGFINYIDRVPIWTVSLPSRIAGSVALVSQSGATAAYLAGYCAQQGIGLSFIVSTGNEADLTVARVVDYLIDDDATRVIAVFLETARDAALLAAAAVRAMAAGKPIVVLKIGAADITARAAQAHTGSLVGDDRVFDAACARFGIIRVQSLEQLMTTAGLLAELKPVRPRRVAAVAISGGICEVASDRSVSAGVPMAELAPATMSALRDVMPEFGTPYNPLDVTGAAMLRPALFEETLRIVGGDPQVGLVACLFDMPKGGRVSIADAVLPHVGRAFADIDAQGLLISVMPTPVDAATAALARQHGLTYLGAGVASGMAAIGHLLWWSERHESGVAPRLTSAGATNVRPATERETMAFLAERNVPVVPSVLTTTQAQAMAAAAAFGGAVALKIASPDIAHKTDAGGVRLSLLTPDDVADAFTRIMEDVAAAAPNARIEGILVSPMRERGVELLVGITRDPQWGLAITVGLGGVWVEVLRDTAVRLLPVRATDVLDMLGELRGCRILDGYRGGTRCDRQAIAEVVAAIGDAAMALGPDLAALEINPLLVDGSRVEALDALVLFQDSGSKHVLF
jgi:acyl-CoA synthetase (NDP forming)